MLLQLHWLLQVCIGDKTGLYNVARQVHPVIFSTSAGLMVGGLVVVVQTASAWLKLYTLTTPVANLLPDRSIRNRSIHCYSECCN